MKPTNKSQSSCRSGYSHDRSCIRLSACSARIKQSIALAASAMEDVGDTCQTRRQLSSITHCTIMMSNLSCLHSFWPLPTLCPLTLGSTEYPIICIHAPCAAAFLPAPVGCLQLDTQLDVASGSAGRHCLGKSFLMRPADGTCAWIDCYRPRWHNGCSKTPLSFAEKRN